MLLLNFLFAASLLLGLAIAVLHIATGYYDQGIYFGLLVVLSIVFWIFWMLENKSSK
jgi:hypothetical protein